MSDIDPLAGLRKLAADYPREKPITLPLHAFDKCSNVELYQLGLDFLMYEMADVVKAFKLRLDLKANKDFSKSNCYMVEAYRKTIISALLKLQIKQDVAMLHKTYPAVFWRE